MGGPRKNYDEAVKLYKAGLSIGEVAAQYGVTRQAMHVILKRRNVKMRPQLRFGKANHFYRGGSRKNKRAASTLEKAVLKGLVVRPARCSKCRATPTFQDGRSAIQAHHADYNKPLDVMWLCQRCHHEWHKKHRARERRS